MHIKNIKLFSIRAKSFFENTNFLNNYNHKFIAVIVSFAMLLPLFAVNIPAHTLSNIMTFADFETGAAPFAYSGTSTEALVLTQETTTPLIGSGSLKIAGAATQNSWDGVKAAILGTTESFDGFALRFKTDAGEGRSLRFYTEEGLTFGNNIKYFDLAGNEVVIAEGAVVNGEYVRVPANFDGYIFVPFSGKIAGGALDITKTVNFWLWFNPLQNNWANTTTIIDNASYYKGSDYVALMTALNPITESANLYTLSDFEDGTAPFAYNGSSAVANQPVVSHETTSPLIGQGSLKLEYTTVQESWDGILGALPAAPTAFDGLLLRLKTNIAIEKSIRFYTPEGTTLGNNTKLFDTKGNEIGMPDGVIVNAEYVRLPANFDGYIFVPFSGKIGGPAIDTTKTVNLWIWTTPWSNGGFDNSITYFDSLSYYSGSDYLGLMKALDPKSFSNVYTFSDFETGTAPFSYNGSSALANQPAISQETVNPLIGTGSLKIEYIKEQESWDGVIAAIPATNRAYDGIALRIKTNITIEKSIRLYTPEGTTLGNNTKFYDMDGNEIAMPDGAIVNAEYVRLPANFDGYIFVPFSGKIGGPDIDTTKIVNLWIWLTPWSNGGFDNSITLIDNVSYYKGTNVKSNIKELDPSSEIVIDDNATGTTSIFDFNTVQPFSSKLNTGSLLTLIHETVKPLIKEGSLKLYFDYNFDAESINADVTTSGETNKGLVFRLKSDAPRDSLFSVILNQNNNSVHLGKNVKFLDNGGNTKTPNPSTLEAEKAIIIPAFFDGYVFIPFEGKFESTVSVDITSPFNLQLGFLNNGVIGVWNCGQTVIDSIAFYNGADYEGIMNLIDPARLDNTGEEDPDGEDPGGGDPTIGDDSNATPSTIVTTDLTTTLINFENGAQPVKTGNKAQVTLAKVTDAPLIDTASIKLEFTDVLGPWGFVETQMPGVTGTYDGIFIRIKTTADEGAILRALLFQEINGESVQIGIGKTPRFFDKYGKDVTLENPVSAAWQGVQLPQKFDGFVFMPFSGQYAGTGNVTLDITKPFKLWYLFANNEAYEAVWDSTTALIDNTGYYKGEDFKQIIKEIDPATDFNGSSGDGGNTGGVITSTTPYLNKEFGIEIFGFTDGALPLKTQLAVQKLENTAVQGAYSEFITQNGATKDELVGTYNLQITNALNNPLDPKGLIAVNVTVPPDYIPENLGLCYYDTDGSLKYLKTSLSVDYKGETSIKCYTRFMGTFAVINVGDKFSDANKQESTVSSQASSSPSSKAISKNTSTAAASSESSSSSSSSQEVEISFDVLTDASLDLAIATTAGDTVILTLKDEAILTTKMQQRLIDSGKNLIIRYKDANGEIKFAWQFTKLTKAVGDINLALNAVSSNKDKLLALIGGNSNFQILSLKHSGELPGSTKIIIKNTAGFTKDMQLLIQYYNETTGKFEQLQTLAVLSADLKYIQLDIPHCSDFVLMKTETATPEAKTAGIPIYLIIIIIVAAVIVITGSTFLVIKKKR